MTQWNFGYGIPEDQLAALKGDGWETLDNLHQIKTVLDSNDAIFENLYNAARRFPTRLPVSYNGAGLPTVNTGVLATPAVSLTGTSVSNTIANVSVIANPSSWTTLFSVTGKANVFIGFHSTPNAAFGVACYTSETSGRAVRGRIVRDGVVIWDNTAYQNTAWQSAVLPGRPSASTDGIIIPIKSSLLVQVCCNGALSTSTYTWVYMGGVYTEFIE